MADDGTWAGADPAAAPPRSATPAPWTISAPTPAAAPPPAAPASWTTDAPGAPWATGPVPAADRPSRRALPWVLGALAVGAVATGGYFVADALSADSAATTASGGAGAYGAPLEQQQETAGQDEEPAGASAEQTTAAPTSGPLVVLEPVSVTATCQAPPGIDSTGAAVTYEPEHTLDLDPSTAWRCPGSAVDAQLAFEFAEPVTIATVALVPGYAKVDPADGSQRFPENRTVTAVSWRYENDEFVQQIPTPQPSMTAGNLPAPVQTDRIVLEISGTGNDAAVRDFTAISDVRFTGYRAGTP